MSIGGFGRLSPQDCSAGQKEIAKLA